MLVGRDGATFPQQAVRRAAPRRLAGIAGARRPRSRSADASFRLLGIEPVTLPAEVGNAPAIGTQRTCNRSSRRRDEMLVAPETLSDLKLPEGARRIASGGTLLPPLRVQAQLVPGVLVVDIGIAQRLLNMPDQVSRLLIGKAKGKPRARLKASPATDCAWSSRMRRAISNASPTAFTSNLTAFGLLSFCGRTVHRQFGRSGLRFEQRLPMLRTLARLRGVGTAC